MKETDIQKIIDMNYRSLTLLGYAMALLHGMETQFSGRDQIKYVWFMDAVDRVVYRNEPLPPTP